MNARTNWLNSLHWQISFYMRAWERRRIDGEMDWRGFDRSRSGRYFTLRRRIKRVLHKAGFKIGQPLSVDWLHANADKLWETRAMLVDELSKLLFDSSLVVRLTSHRHFYFPRIDFEDLVTVNGQQPFDADNLPKDYLGTPLQIYDIEYANSEGRVALKLISTAPQISWLNSYRQYLIERPGFHVRPIAGDVVLDCGACIGDFSILFAGLVGVRGQVHAFDPIPLHNKYCSLQASLNPSLAPALFFNTLAVGSRSFSATGPRIDSDRIDPGQIRIDSFDCTTLDDYASDRLPRVDFIKMDIEGAELDAIEGARDLIQAHKPRLAISAYHKPEDLWEIPQKLKALNPRYDFIFGHHSPVHWESVFYTVSRKS